ncbi:MAG: 3-oxoadipate enol-lactonase [Gammaproteobacteria bacterium]|jgi:3-oxoadipate enol-lactonase
MNIGHVVKGSGSEKVIIMHDWQGDHRNYDGIIPYLDTDTFTYAFMDLRGYGWSRDIAGEHTAAEASADAIGLAEQLGFDSFHVVGHSMTGMVVQRIAIDAGPRIKSVVAANPVPACGIKMPADNLAFFESSIRDDAAFKTLLMGIVSPALSATWQNYKLHICRDSADFATRSDYLRMFTSTDFSAEAQGIETPILVLGGEYDHESLSESALTETFGSWYPNATIKICVNAGHYLMEEMPIYFVSAIEAFMREHGA